MPAAIKNNLQTVVQTALQTATRQGLSRIDAQMLLLHALGQSTNNRAWLVSHDTEELSAPQLQSFETLVMRRLAGEPLAYITGRREFFGLNLMVNGDVLDPRPDTECLVEWALEVIPIDLLAHVLDLGTGSGAIGLAVKAHRPKADVTLVDASAPALAVALGNAATLGLAVHGLQSDWFEQVQGDARFDVILSNPPYIALGDAHLTALVHEPQLALTSGVDGMEALHRIIQNASTHLAPGGWLLLEHGYDQAQKVQAALTLQGFEQVSSRPDLNGIVRCTGGRFQVVPKKPW